MRAQIQKHTDIDKVMNMYIFPCYSSHSLQPTQSTVISPMRQISGIS